MAAKAHRPSFWRRVWHVIEWTALVVIGAIFTILVSLNLSIVRNAVRNEANAVLRTTFAGQIVVDRIATLSVTGVDGVRVRIGAPDGTELLLVEDANVHVDVISTLRSVVRKSGDLIVDITSVKLGYVDAHLATDKDGNLKLAQAFEPREAKPETAAPSSRATVVHLRKIALRHGWVHGQPEGAPLVDVDVDGLDLSLIVGGTRTAADLATVDVTARALPQVSELRTHIEAHYAKPAEGKEQAGRVDLRGTLGERALVAEASIDGAKIAAKLDVGPGMLHVEANAVNAEEKALHATLKARDINLRAFSPGALVTRVGADAAIDVVVNAKGDGKGSYTLEVPPGEVAGSAVPAAHLAGAIEVARSESGATSASIDGNGDIDEPGAHTTLRFQAKKDDASTKIAFRINAVAPRLDGTRLGNGFSGSATIDVDGAVTLAKTTMVDGTADFRGTRVAAGGARLERAAVQARVSGDPADPTIDVRAQANQVAASGMQFATATLAVAGTQKMANVSASLVPVDGPRLDARTAIALGKGVALLDTRVAVARDNVNAVLQIAKVRFADHDVSAEGVTLEGVGDTLRAELAKTPQELIVKAASQGLELQKIARLLHTDELQGGRVALDVDMSVRGNAAKGHLRADLSDGAFARVKNAKGNVDARFEGRNIEAEAHADLGAIGRLDVADCHFELDANKPLAASALEKMRGKLSIDSNVDLAKIRALLPHGAIPLTDMQGVVRVKGDILRKAAGEVPEVHLTGVTRGLLLSGRGDREEVDGIRVDTTPPWRIEGVDVEIGTTVSRETGATAVKGRLLDREGTIVSLDVSTGAMPYRHWLAGKTVDQSELAALSWNAKIDVPKRELKRFPPIMRTRQMTGTLGASATFKGSLAKPDLHLLVEANDWAAPVPRDMPAINAKIDAQYRESQGAIALAVSSKDKQLLDGKIEIRGDLPGMATNESSKPWRASTKLHVAEFPLETVGTFADLQIKGLVSGDVTMDDVHDDARAKVEIALRNLELGRALIPRGQVNVDFDGQTLRGVLRLDQKDGYLQADTQFGMRWGAQTAPTIAKGEAAFASLKTHAFRAAAFLPFASGVVSALDGRIEADARVDLTPGGGPPKMRGNVALTKGHVQVARLGEPLNDVAMKIDITPDGVVRLENLEARGSTGQLDAKGVVRLNGFDLVSARANVHIPKNNPFPVDIDGTAIGDIDADIGISADMAQDKRTLDVKIDIPRLHAQLPLTSTNSPQELGEAPKIRVGYFRRPTHFIALPKDAEDLKKDDEVPPDKEATVTNLSIHLGDDVEVRRGTNLRIAVKGSPKVELGEKAKVSGQLKLTRGMLEVQGRRFQIETGTVTFVGDDPSNPQIVVTAAWDAPDGTRVYADFVGPLKTGTVRLRSEPGRPQNEILALIMFGTAEGSSSTPYPTQEPNGATRAGAMAGGLATEGLSKGLDQLTGLDVATKIDTSNAANPRPEIELQIARDISVQLAYVLGTPSPGMNPDRTFITLDWRFLRRWSMETTFGDQGSSIVDLLWQYRY